MDRKVMLSINQDDAVLVHITHMTLIKSLLFSM